MILTNMTTISLSQQRFSERVNNNQKKVLDGGNSNKPAADVKYHTLCQKVKN